MCKKPRFCAENTKITVLFGFLEWSKTIKFLIRKGIYNEDNWIDKDSRFTHLKKTDPQVIEIESNEDILLKIINILVEQVILLQ